MDAASFGALFDSFTHTAFRLETRQTYEVSAEDESFRAFREGAAQPERSVRTSPWMRRIALSTAQGKEWSRIHLIRHPLSEYLRWELGGYVESQAVGERIGLVDLDEHPEHTNVGPDFWLFDAETDHPQAVLMHYDDAGNLLGREHATHALLVKDALDYTRRLLADIAIPLNTYLAGRSVA